MKPVKKKKGGGFWRGVFLFLLGVTFGMGGAAVSVAYVNKLHLPFIEPPTRSPGLSGEQTRQRSEEEALQFRDVLRSRQPQPLQEEEEDKQPPSQPAYYLQIGAFRDNGAAEELRGEMSLLGRAAIIKSGQAADGAQLHRVWVGPYNDESQAEAARAQLVLEGVENISLLRTSGQ